MAYNASEYEKKLLAFWKENNTFEKSVQERPENKPYVFYDGPPFATGLPHYGHIVASVMKDVVPRYHTMQGYRVERIWGWDCHGLPIENIVEKELGTKSKQEVEVLGVDIFNEKCRSKVLSYVEEWEKTITRLGRWVDMKNSYRTMDKEYMESIWWVFKSLWEKDLIYKGYKPMHICPRCETTLSQQEVSEGYKDVKDLSVTAQFRIVGHKLSADATKLFIDELKGDVFFLAWTTTPWTLPGNVLLAVGADIEYAIVKLEDAHYVVAKELLMKNFEGKEFEVVGHAKGIDLVGYLYEPLFPYFADSENSFRVVTADFVTTEDGTGIVHLAPAFGTDDYEVFKKENVPFIQHVKMNGCFIDEVTDFAGKHVKPLEDHMATDVEIIKWLAHNGKLFSKKKYEHSYPHCWRCDTPLINYATDSWFVAVEKIKTDALEQAKKINWSPEHIKEGRFGKWLEGARDWSISRQRFWASVMPVWECDSSNGEQSLENVCSRVVVGSVAELEELSGEKIEDLHKHIVDKITFACKNCGGKMKRIPEVLDTWFDSGSMPYAQLHYPFENKEVFEKGFPAQFIAEGQDQTRAWFYYLHVLSTALRGTPAFQNVIVNGIVLAEDGKKMSKKLKNYPDPNEVLEKYGADSLRFYLMISPVVAAENLSFAEAGVREVFNKVVNTLANVLAFYELYSDIAEDDLNSDNVLDIWILAKLNQLVVKVTNEMDAYKLHEASRPIMDFILDLSQWYVRRSRDRFRDGDAAGVTTLKTVLITLSKVLAPFTPFIAETVFQTVSKSTDSVHLTLWPEQKTAVDSFVIEDMENTRLVVEYGLSLRKQAKIKVRQPLAKLAVDGVSLSKGHHALIAEEVNVKEIVESISGDQMLKKEDHGITVSISTLIDETLEKEGVLRELIRAVNMMRKDSGLTVESKAAIVYSTNDDLLKSVIIEYADDLLKGTASTSIEQGQAENELKINNRLILLSVKKC